MIAVKLDPDILIESGFCPKRTRSRNRRSNRLNSFSVTSPAMTRPAARVELHRGYELEYPARCVVCDLSSPSEMLRFGFGPDRGFGLPRYVMPRIPRDTPLAPICSSCRTQVRRSSWVRLLLVAGPGIIFAFATGVVSFSLHESMRKDFPEPWASLLATLSFMVIALVVGIVVAILDPGRLPIPPPPPVRVSATARTITLSFTNREYAREFARRNRRFVIASGDGP